MTILRNENYEAVAHLAAERLKGLQGQERQIKDLKRELAREKAINDALTEANRNGRAQLHGLERQMAVATHPQGEGKTWRVTEEQLDMLKKQLEEAREAAARADKVAEGLYQDLYTYKDCAEKRLMKIRRQEQTIQTLENALSCEEDEAARLRGEVIEANRCNENQRKLIQTLRERVGAAAGTAGEVIEVIDALLGDGGGFCGVWDPDVENFADALKAKLREEP